MNRSVLLLWVMLVLLLVVLGGSCWWWWHDEVCPWEDTADPWWQHVDKILYLNLPNRTDRQQQMQETLSRTLGLPDDRVERVVALRDTPGWRGCARSHALALELAQQRQYRYVCVLEDDFWPLCTGSRFHAAVTQAWRTLQGQFDVLMLGCTPVRLQRQHTEPLYRVRQALALPGYVVARHYVPKLLQSFRQSLVEQQPIDFGTQTLQKVDRWYGFFPPLARQRPGFSDIEQRHTDYGYLEIEAKMLEFTD